jgi:hypothetical protein
MMVMHWSNNGQTMVKCRARQGILAASVRASPLRVEDLPARLSVALRCAVVKYWSNSVQIVVKVVNIGQIVVKWWSNMVHWSYWGSSASLRFTPRRAAMCRGPAVVKSWSKDKPLVK